MSYSFPKRKADAFIAAKGIDEGNEQNNKENEAEDGHGEASKEVKLEH